DRRSADLEVRGCVKRFRGAGREVLVALDRVDLTVSAGQVVALLGSNGAGKSTLLSIVGGSLLPDEGSVVVGGRDITGLPSWKRVGCVSRVRQNPEHNVLSALTIEENFSLAIGSLRRRFGFRLTGGRQVREVARESLRPFGLGLEDRLRVLAGTLSGGQRQAVAVAMATLGHPDVLLLDEHVAALDPKSARLVSDETERIVREASITTLMVTHDMGHALERADRLLMLHRGRIVMDLEGSEKDALDVHRLINRFEELTGDEMPDRTLLSAGAAR
ncbi:MAG TPA: ATP-binding cassette domain-containing protein, partial [Capillimicrobium sp.]